MMGRTHAFAGVCSLWLLVPVPHLLTSENFSPLAAVAAVGALMPDLDATQSLIRSTQVAGIRPFVPIAAILHSTFGHRGLIHSALGLLLFCLLVAVPLAFWWGALPSLVLALGYASHLAADACTKSGIPLLYPRKVRFHLMPPPLRLSTGSQAEDAVLIAFALLALMLVLYFQMGTSPSFSATVFSSTAQP